MYSMRYMTKIIACSWATTCIASDEITKSAQGVWLTNYPINALYGIIEEYDYVGDAAKNIALYLINDRDALGRSKVKQAQNLLEEFKGRTYCKTYEATWYTHEFKGTREAELFKIEHNTKAGILKNNPNACSVVIALDPIKIEELHCILLKNTSPIDGFKHQCLVQTEIFEGDTNSLLQFFIDMPDHKSIDELYSGDLISLAGETQDFIDIYKQFVKIKPGFKATLVAENAVNIDTRYSRGSVQVQNETFYIEPPRRRAPEGFAIVR